jgi:hypothetical protein
MSEGNSTITGKRKKRADSVAKKRNTRGDEDVAAEVADAIGAIIQSGVEADQEGSDHISLPTTVLDSGIVDLSQQGTVQQGTQADMMLGTMSHLTNQISLPEEHHLQLLPQLPQISRIPSMMHHTMSHAMPHPHQIAPSLSHALQHGLHEEQLDGLLPQPQQLSQSQHVHDELPLPQSISHDMLHPHESYQLKETSVVDFDKHVKTCNFGKYGHPCNQIKLSKFPQCKIHYNLLQRVRRNFGVKEGEITQEMLQSCIDPKPSGLKRTQKVEGESVTLHCRKCNVWKPDICFHKDARSSSGRQSICKECKVNYLPKTNLRGEDFVSELVVRLCDEDRQARAKLGLSMEDPHDVITSNFICMLNESCGNRCARTAIPLEWSNKAQAYQGAISRHNPALPHTQSNVELVCLPVARLLRSEFDRAAIDGLVKQMRFGIVPMQRHDGIIPAEMQHDVTLQQSDVQHQHEEFDRNNAKTRTVVDLVVNEALAKVAKDVRSPGRRDVLFDLVCQLAKEQGNRCRLSGIPLEWEKTSIRRPFLDRISCKKPFDHENSQLCIQPVQRMKHQLSDTSLQEFFNTVRKYSQQKN